MAARMNIKLIAGLAAAAIVASAAPAWLTQRPQAPEVTFATLSGQTLGTSDLRGKVLLVNFWATSCVPCATEMPRVAQTYRKFAPRGYDTIAVAMSHDRPDQVAEFARRRALPFKVALDGSGEIARDFGGVRVTPTLFLIDRRGRIVKRYIGKPDWRELHSLVEEALDQPV